MYDVFQTAFPPKEPDTQQVCSRKPIFKCYPNYRFGVAARRRELFLRTEVLGRHCRGRPPLRETCCDRSNVGKEPKLYVGIAYCACSQHKFFCKGKNSPAVLPLENRTLCTTAAIPRRQNYDRGTNRPLACQNTMIDSEVAGKNGISSPEPVLAAIRLSSRCLVA